MNAKTQPRRKGMPTVNVKVLSINQIKPHDLNPRREFDEAELRELSESLKEVGLIEPLIVRKVIGSKCGYELIAGERRLRAAMLAGWKKITAIIKDVSDREALTMQLVENLQRVDLNPVEVGRGIDRLLQSQSDDGSPMMLKEVAAMLGKTGTWCSNRWRMLKLPEAWQSRIASGEIPFGASLSLLPFSDQPTILARIEQDMAESPWAYRAAIDFTNNVRRIAADQGPTGALHPKASTEPRMRKKPEPPQRRGAGQERSEAAEPLEGIGEDGPDVVAFPAIRREGSGDLLPSMLAVIEVIDDVDQLIRLLHVVEQRLAAVRASQVAVED